MAETVRCSLPNNQSYSSRVGYKNLSSYLDLHYSKKNYIRKVYIPIISTSLSPWLQHYVVVSVPPEASKATSTYTENLML